MRNGPYELIVPPEDYPGKRYRGRYAYEHRVNWWRKTGKNPDDFPGHVIHHEDEEKRNNVDQNLEAMPRSTHTAAHNAARPKVPTVYEKCRNCEVEFVRLNRKPQFFCSRRCIGLYNFPRRKGKGM